MNYYFQAMSCFDCCQAAGAMPRPEEGSAPQLSGRQAVTGISDSDSHCARITHADFACSDRMADSGIP